MNGPTPRDRFAQIVRAEQVDLGLATLFLAAEARPNDVEHDVAESLHTLDRFAESLPSTGTAVSRLRATLGAFHGDETEYARLDASLLPQVLVRQRGLPILLSVLWLEVARRAGIPAYGIGLPGHFIVGVGQPDGFHEMVDPFRGGRTLRESDIGRLTGNTLQPSALRPWEAIEILQRILNNIRAWAGRPERLPTRRWAIELALLLPRHPLELRRQHGMVLVQLGGFSEGALALEQYADRVEGVDVQAAEQARSEARQARARLN